MRVPGKLLSTLLAAFAVLPALADSAPQTVRVDYYHTGNADTETFSLHQVVVDKPAGMAGLPGRDAELLLQRSERADPAPELEQHAVDHTGNVQEAHPPPLEDKQAAQHHERDEEEVGYYHEVGCDPRRHGNRIPHPRGKTKAQA